MAAFVWTDAELVVFDESGGSDLSDHVLSLQMSQPVDTPEATAMGTIYRQRLQGLRDWSVECTMKQDFAAGSVDDTITAAQAVQGGIVITVKPVKSVATGPTNPKFSGLAVISQYNPFGNNVGDLATATVTFMGAGNLTRVII